jgi:hypothetical protein
MVCCARRGRSSASARSRLLTVAGKLTRRLVTLEIAVGGSLVFAEDRSAAAPPAAALTSRRLPLPRGGYSYSCASPLAPSLVRAGEGSARVGSGEADGVQRSASLPAVGRLDIDGACGSRDTA